MQAKENKLNKIKTKPASELKVGLLNFSIRTFLFPSFNYSFYNEIVK